jgi:hypothetical protein
MGYLRSLCLLFCTQICSQEDADKVENLRAFEQRRRLEIQSSLDLARRTDNHSRICVLSVAKSDQCSTAAADAEKPVVSVRVSQLFELQARDCSSAVGSPQAIQGDLPISGRRSRSELQSPASAAAESVESVRNLSQESPGDEDSNSRKRRKPARFLL